MRSLLFTILVSIILSANVSVAQNSGPELTTEELRDLSITSRLIGLNAVETKGSPFLNEAFSNGSITFENGKTTNVMPMRFNVYEGTVQFRDNENIYAIEGKTIREFELYASDGIVKFKKGFDSRRLSPDQFVAVLADGKAKFMVRHSVNYREDVGGYGQATQVEEYSSSESYYVKFGDNDTEQLRRLGQRRVLRAFPSHKDDLETFARQNNLSFDSPYDVADLFKYYNTLIR